MAKLTTEQIQELLDEKDFTIIDISNYKNLTSIIEIKCKDNHIIQTNLKTIRTKSFRCPKCDAGKVEIKNNPPSKNGKRVIGIDNATKKMGVSIFDDGKLVYYTVLRFTGTLESRLTQIYNILKDYIIPKWEPDFIAFEDIQLQGNEYRTFKALAMLLGIMTTVTNDLGIKYDTVMSGVWRSHFSIQGKTRAIKKVNAIKKVKDMYDIETNDDAAEAILIGKYAVNKFAEKNMKPLFGKMKK